MIIVFINYCYISEHFRASFLSLRFSHQGGKFGEKEAQRRGGPCSGSCDQFRLWPVLL